MADVLCLPVIAAAVLLWYLACALCQLRSEAAHTPIFVWREASETTWSDWIELEGVSPSADYATVLTAVRGEAHAYAVAVQFASVVRPPDAPDFTLRVLFTSAVREPSHDRTLAITR
ncbi:MAG: hypothetical protein ACRDUX_24730 [Mycobacterium sp.]